MTPVVGFAGYSGSGKTTLIEQVIALLVARGLKVSLIKHAHHAFDVDVPGKDSWRHRQAGALEVLVASSQRWALMHELRGTPEPSLDELLAVMAPCDLIIVEGYKRSAVPKIEVWRRASGLPRLAEGDQPELIAVASDEPVEDNLPRLDVNEPDAVANFLVNRFGLS
jgi:molybdopterin-guanine dinucleotide biosynthesis protein B